MIIKDLADCRYFRAADSSSLPHRLKTSSELYFILEGEGLMHIDSEQARVRAGQAILIPPGSQQGGL